MKYKRFVHHIHAHMKFTIIERKKKSYIFLLFERRKREAVKKRCKLTKNIKQKQRRSLSGYISLKREF